MKKSSPRAIRTFGHRFVGHAFIVSVEVDALLAVGALRRSGRCFTLVHIYTGAKGQISSPTTTTSRQSSCGKPQEAYHRRPNLSKRNLSWRGEGLPHAVLAEGYPCPGTGVAHLPGTGVPIGEDIGPMEVL